MAYIKYSKVFLAKERARKQRNFEAYQNAIKSIENDDEYKKLYKIVKQKYLDNSLNPIDIDINEVISLDFEYFAYTYGEKAFIARDKSLIRK